MQPDLYIDDLLDAISYIINNSNDNIGPTGRTTVRHIAETVNKYRPSLKYINYQDNKSGWKGDVYDYDYNVEKLTDLGFTTKYSSDEAVEKTVKNMVLLLNN